MVDETRMYGHEYFDDPESGSGYTHYEDDESFIRLSEVFVENLQPRRVLDVGCAKGYLMGRFIERGIETCGIDTSEYAVGEASEAVRAHIQIASILDIPFPDDSFDLVICMETLEHIEPHLVTRAISELARVSSQHVLASMPSYGFNDYGPQGWRMSESQREDAEAGHAFADIDLDELGQPRHGHVTLATYRWWTARFAEAGLYRLGWLERRMTADERMKKMWWQIHVLRKTAEPSPATLWPPIVESKLVAGRRDADQLGPGFYHYDHLLGGRWTRDQALFFLAHPGRTWLYLEYMLPAGLPAPALPYVEVEGRRLSLPEAPGGWRGHHVRLEGKAAPLAVLVGVERDWSPAEAFGSADENRYGLALRYAALCRFNTGMLRLLLRRLGIKLAGLSGRRRGTTP